MSAKRSSKNIKGKKKGSPPSNRKKEAGSASKPKVVVQTSSVAKKEAPKPKAEKSATPSQQANAAISLPFTRQNYLLLAVGVGIIILGFFLMSLDNFVDATKFSISLYIAPIVVMAGFAEIIYAIMYRPKSSPQTQETGK